MSAAHPLFLGFTWRHKIRIAVPNKFQNTMSRGTNYPIVFIDAAIFFSPQALKISPKGATLLVIGNFYSSLPCLFTPSAKYPPVAGKSWLL
jgi:hypothetical protein